MPMQSRGVRDADHAALCIPHGKQPKESEHSSVSEPAPNPSAPAPSISMASMAPSPSALPERRQLIIVLAVIEGALLLLPLFFGAFIWAQPIPVDQGPGGVGCVSAGSTTVLSSGSSCGSGSSMPLLALLAVLSVLLALLVLPVLIGFVSRRWQTALAVPSAPVWVLTVIAAVLIALSRGTSLYGYGGNTPIDGYNPIFSLIFNTPLVLMILVTGALGGLAWLIHRGFSR